jgi:hypothetical protein
MVTLGGIFIVPSDVQPENESSSINNKLPPSATADILAQLKNAPMPIDSILPAIVSALVMLEHPSNA